MANEPEFTTDKAWYVPGEPVVLSTVFVPSTTTITGTDQAGRPGSASFTVGGVSVASDPEQVWDEQEGLRTATTQVFHGVAEV